MSLVYSCCFWFSLRLGGILIAIFSILQGLAVLISSCVAYSLEQNLRESTTAFFDTLNLLYIKSFIDNFNADPQKYLSLCISFSCLYIIICLSYAYGAYKFNNILMIGYILVELLRLIFLTFVIITWLLVLKENTMDIGIHIGASVVGSFFLLGMFYLWICAANLPILINEMERDQQNATIYKLQKQLTINNAKSVQDPQNTLAITTGTYFNLNRSLVLPASIQKNKFFRSNFDNRSYRPTYSQFDY